MPPDQNSPHSRRPHYHRGRRGPDRRGGERRPSPPQPPPEGGNRDNLDIEQIMREIRTRVSERHGIELSNQQIQELAARRLEAILDPSSIKPSLMDELRRASGQPPDPMRVESEGVFTFEESALLDSPSGLVRFLRRLLNPLLRLLFNPDVITSTLAAQARLNKAAAARQADERRRQTEWNALHFEILRRLVTDIARADLDSQTLALRVESLAGKVDFNERRVRGLEQTQHQARPMGRAPEAPPPQPSAAPIRDEAVLPQQPSSDGTDSGRRRRRRRRGRRSGGPPGREMGTPALVPSGSRPADQIAEGDELLDDDMALEESPDDEAGDVQQSEAAVTGLESAPVNQPAPQVEPVIPQPSAAPPETRDQGTGIGDQGSAIGGQVSGIADQESGSRSEG